MQVGYGIIMEGAVFNFMRKIEIDLYDRFGFKNGMQQGPHITVKPPFEVQQISEYVEYLEVLCEKIEPLEIELEGFNSFGKKVIYMDVKNTEILSKIYETISSDLNIHVENEEMIFHGTLAYNDIKEEDFDKAYKYLNEKFKPKFKVVAKKIGLFYKLPEDNGWIIIKECKIK